MAATMIRPMLLLGLVLVLNECGVVGSGLWEKIKTYIPMAR